MQPEIPCGPSQSADTPVGIVARTVGGVNGLVPRFIELMSKTMTLELPLPTKRTLPSAVVVLPSGPDIGFTPLAREAQHWAPGNPPRLPLGPKPVFRWNLGPFAQVISVLQAYLTKLPNTSTVGGMISTVGVGEAPV